MGQAAEGHPRQVQPPRDCRRRASRLHLSKRPEVAPLAPERFRVQFTIGAETEKKLRRLQELLKREIPDGDPAVIFDRAVTVLLEKVESRKNGVPRSRGRARRSKQDRAMYRAATRREVVAPGLRRNVPSFPRTGGGVPSAHYMEFHHRGVPFAHGGGPGPENIALALPRAQRLRGATDLRRVPAERDQGSAGAVRRDVVRRSGTASLKARTGPGTRRRGDRRRLPGRTGQPVSGNGTGMSGRAGQQEIGGHPDVRAERTPGDGGRVRHSRQPAGRGARATARAGSEPARQTARIRVSEVLMRKASLSTVVRCAVSPSSPLPARAVRCRRRRRQGRRPGPPASPREAGEAREDRVPDLLRGRVAGALRPRGRAAALVLVRRGREGLRKDRRRRSRPARWRTGAWR